MRRLQSAAFKILALLEFGCSVQNTSFKLMGEWERQTPKATASAWGTWTPIYYTHAVTNLTHLLQRQLDRWTHFRTTTQQSPHWLQWDAQNSPSKLPFRLRRSPPPSNTPIPRPTTLTIPNGIRIKSAVLPQYTFLTDTHTDRHMG